MKHRIELSSRGLFIIGLCLSHISPELDRVIESSFSDEIKMCHFWNKNINGMIAGEAPDQTQVDRLIDKVVSVL